jgi:glucose/arabinose dehydrogenase
MRHIRRAAVLVACISAVSVLAACDSSESQSNAPARSPDPARTTPVPSGRDGAVTLTRAPRPVTADLEAPWSVVFRNGAALVSERDSGRILELAEGGATRVVGTIAGVAGSGEGGLLGMAVDDRGRLYVYSTGEDGNRIERYELTGDPGSLGLGSRVTLVDEIPSASYHDGGRIAFGPDGMLYATVGDAGQSASAQDLDSLAGKILRMTPDGDVPDDNPFPDSLVFSYGHRNPQGLAWAPDGTMFATEFGQDAWDELNVIVPGGNYGWPDVEGIADDDEFRDPVQQWEPADASPSGMTAIGGTLFIANLRGEVLRAVPIADPSTSRDYYAGEYGRIRDVVGTPDGDLWFVTNNTDGRGEPGPGDDRILSVRPSR